MKNQNLIIPILLLTVAVFILPLLAKAETRKIEHTCRFGQFTKTVECYYSPNSLIGGRMRLDCICCGQCDLSDVLAFGLNITDLIFKFLGLVALVLFIYGGIRWIFSGGNPVAIKTGKAVVSGALIGMVIVLVAFLIVQTILKSLGVSNEYLLK